MSLKEYSLIEGSLSSCEPHEDDIVRVYGHP